MRHIYIVAIAFLITLEACTPRPVFRMSPADKHSTFDQGSEYVQRQKKDVKLIVSYYRHVSNRFVMDVEIDNNTDSVIRVVPAQFCIMLMEDIKAIDQVILPKLWHRAGP